MQVASKVLSDKAQGLKIAGFDIDDETIVVSLFHDIGFTICNENHAKMAAQMLKPYISERQYWMLSYHDRFQWKYLRHHPEFSDEQRNYAFYRWGQAKKHKYYDYTTEWVKRYDLNSMDPYYKEEPIETFIPIVKKIFSTKKNK